MNTFKGWRITRNGIIAIAVLIVLSIVLYFGILMVANRGEQARQQEAAQIALQNLEKDSEGPAVIAAAPTQSAPESESQSGGATAPIPTVLPETGTGLFGLIPVAVLTYAAALFVTSRRRLAQD